MFKHPPCWKANIFPRCLKLLWLRHWSMLFNIWVFSWWICMFRCRWMCLNRTVGGDWNLGHCNNCYCCHLGGKLLSILVVPKLSIKSGLCSIIQTLANRGNDSTIIDVASITRSSPKLSRSRVIKLMLWIYYLQIVIITRVTCQFGIIALVSIHYYGAEWTKRNRL